MANELTLINEIDVKAVAATLSKVRSLQATLKGLLVENHDFGKIPGCGDKPTLLKPGAEKILTALGLSSSYELIEHTEDFKDKGFFSYTVKCTLEKNGLKITEGLGQANSKEKKWAYEFVLEKDLPAGTDKELLKSKKFEGKFGTYYKFEIEADANSKANTILKMAKKRAQIDAVLTVASLSEIFTQDFDDLPPEEIPTTEPIIEKAKTEAENKTEYYCAKCGKGISEKVYSYSLKNKGEALCMDCQKGA